MCLTCDIITGKFAPVGGIIYKDDLVILHQCIDVNIAGYMILSPVRHVEQYNELSEAEILKIGIITKLLDSVLRNVDGIEKVYLAHLGEETSHFHVHVFPRYKWMVDKHVEDVRSNNKVDGAKLFSICRESYKVELNLMENEQILDVVEHMKRFVKTLQQGGIE